MARASRSAVVRSGANRHDMKKLADLLDALLVEGPLAPDPASRRSAPQRCLDRGYDYAACREAAASRGYSPHIPPKAQRRAAAPAARPPRPPPAPALGGGGRALAGSTASAACSSAGTKKAENYLAFVQLAAILIIYRKLRHARSLSG